MTAVALGRDDLRAAMEGAASSGPDTALVLYDPAAPLDPAFVERGLALLRETGAAAVVAGVRPTDTLKRAGADGVIAETIDRERTFELRAPQIYRAAALSGALARAAPDAVERAIRAGDHALLPALVDGPVRVLALPAREADGAPRG